jgi:hypothetical protein
VIDPLHTPAPTTPRKAPFPHVGSYWQGTSDVRRHGQPLLTDATNDTVHATDAIVCAIPSGTMHAIRYEQESNHSPKGVYLLCCQGQAHGVNPPQYRTTRRGTSEATGSNYSESTTPVRPYGQQQLYNSPQLFTTSVDSCPTWGRTPDAVTL